jgi:hypothetical protein
MSNIDETFLNRLGSELKIVKKEKVKAIYEKVCKVMGDHLKDGYSVKVPSVGIIKTVVGNTLKEEPRVSIRLTVDRELANMVECDFKEDLEDYKNYLF